MASDAPRARRPFFRALPAAAALLFALTLAASAPAQQPPSAADKETARALMDKGDERMDARDYPAAVKAFVAADAIMHLPMTGAAAARAQAAAGLLVEARDTAFEVTRIPVRAGETPPYARARAEAAELIDRLGRSIPSIQITVAGAPAGATIAIDGAGLPAAAASEPRKVNPGPHVITVTAPGFEPARVEITVQEGQQLPVPVTLRPGAAAPPGIAPLPPSTLPPPPPTATSRRGVTMMAVGFSVGGAGLIAGAVTGLLSLSQTSTLKKECGTDCMGLHGSDLAKAKQLANISDIAFVVGVAGVGVGVAGAILSRPHDPPPPAGAWIEPVIGPGTLGLRGAF